ncbi:UPF0175 family protein [candidate division KSB1 bacterium]|nr:UPF0175 family protein [candidate division KSB1 bacterium]
MIQSWTYSQLVKVRQFRPELVDQVVDDILTRQPELNWLVVIGAYLDQEINLGKAAELLGMYRLELQEKFVKQGIPLRLGSETSEEAHAEFAATSEWNTSVKEKANVL